MVLQGNVKKWLQFPWWEKKRCYSLKVKKSMSLGPVSKAQHNLGSGPGPAAPEE